MIRINNRTKDLICGMSLIEVVIAILIISIISLMTIGYLSSSVASYSAISAKNKLCNNGKLVIDRMDRTFRCIANITTGTSTVISFDTSTGSTNTYNFANSNLYENGYLLAENISSLTFSYYDRTNGTLTAPLSASDRALTYRICIDMTFIYLNNREDFDFSFFCAKNGFIK